MGASRLVSACPLGTPAAETRGTQIPFIQPEMAIHFFSAQAPSVAQQQAEETEKILRRLGYPVCPDR